jgi:hypothetical protein
VRIPFIGIQYTIAVAVRSGKHCLVCLPERFFGHAAVTVQIHSVHTATTLDQQRSSAGGRHLDERVLAVISDCRLRAEGCDDSS